MITIKGEEEIKLMKEAGRINYLTHKYLEKKIKPGITTMELNKMADKFIRDHGCTPSFLNYQGYPGSICTSINDEIVHGIPSDRELKNGDILKLDIGVIYKGYHSDSAATYPVGEISKEDEDLLKYTKESLYTGLSKIKAGVHLGDVSNAIEKCAHSHKLSVVEELVGHGVGTHLHEDPDVPNYGKKGTGIILKEGMTIAVEPMLNLGTRYVCMLDDDWTIVTEDEKKSAHFEHTVLVTKNGYEILTGEE